MNLQAKFCFSSIVAVAATLFATLSPAQMSEYIAIPTEIQGCWKQESLKGRFKASAFDDSKGDCIVKISKSKIQRNCTKSSFAGGNGSKEWDINTWTRWEFSRLKRFESVPNSDTFSRKKLVKVEDIIAHDQGASMLEGAFKYESSANRLVLSKVDRCVMVAESEKFGYEAKRVIKEDLSCKPIENLHSLVHVLIRAPNSDCAESAFSEARKVTMSKPATANGAEEKNVQGAIADGRNSLLGDYIGHGGRVKLAITKNTMSVSGGPMTIKANYRVISVEGKKVTVELSAPGTQVGTNEFIINSKGLHNPTSAMFGGDWVRQ